MPFRVLIVPDKFKGTLTAAKAASAIASGWRRARPGDLLTLLPMSDGGDGFGSLTGQLLGAVRKSVETIDAAHQPCRASWWWEPKSRIAILESASVIGLAMLPRNMFHPFQLDTFGLGRLLACAASLGARTCLVGVGGSATNDGGFGLARSLGWEFWDRSGHPITEWTALGQLHRVRPPDGKLGLPSVRVVADVTNPLLGRQGATRVYGPQKGLRPQDLAVAEKCLRRLSGVLLRDLGVDLADTPGSGAAGGLGFGLQAFMGAALSPGFEVFARYAGLHEKLRDADLVITGEGRIDGSSVMGKGVGRIADLCKRRKIPCIGLGGMVEDCIRQSNAFMAAGALVDLTTPEGATAKPAMWLQKLALQTASRAEALGHLP